MYYATINAKGICDGVSELSGVVVDAKMIAIPAFDPSLLGKKWNGSNFVDSGIVPPTPTSDPLMVKIDKLLVELAEVKADVKNIKNKP